MKKLLALLVFFSVATAQMQHDMGSMNQHDMGSMNQHDMGNMNQHDMGNMNQHDMGSMNQHDMGSMNMGDASSRALAKLSGKSYDIAWLSQMIEHHSAALTMSRDCLKSCTRAEVKAAAQKIVNAQDQEIKQMTKWLKTWYNAKPDPAQMRLMRQDMKPMMDAAKLGMTPMAGMTMNTDKAFLEGMIPHHQHAVEMGLDAKKRAARAELRRFGATVATDQTKEIKQFQTWLKSL